MPSDPAVLRRALKLLLLLPLLAQTGCGLVRAVVATPTVRDTKAMLTGIDFEEATIEFRFTVDNPNVIGATLYRLDYTLDAAGHRCAYGETPDDYRIPVPARGSAEFVLPVKVPYKAIYAAVKETWDAEEIPYALEGGILILEPAFGGIRIPVGTKGSIPSLRPPRLAVRSFRAAFRPIDRLILTVQLEVENRARMPMRLKGLGGALRLNDAPVARIRGIAAGKELPGRETTTIAVPVELSILGLGARIRQIIDAGGGRYALEGTIEVEVLELGTIKRPFKIEGQAKFDR